LNFVFLLDNTYCVIIDTTDGKEQRRRLNLSCEGIC